ncbi:reverse partial [Lasallia pustulata]|uniref:Reverse partial n=1 Tax=Lasallia pustulata TaxID=136370 RepID=A0A1W5DE65_9LECA|nr:reverse partial [Lasallia pustulata]
MFLSKLLSTAESHYWPRELEMAGLVWAIKKLYHLIDSTAKLVIVYTDHSAITSIARQTTLSSSNTDKLNNRLIRASQYLAQFNINVRYKPGKHHLVPDALSRLPVEGSNTDQTLNILNGLTEVEALLVTAIELIFLENDDFDRAAFNVTLVELADEFKDRLKQAYLDDQRWSGIRKSAAEADKSLSMAFPDFRLRNNLLYLIDHNEREQLVIPQSLEKEVFELSHDLLHHQGFHRAFDLLTTSIYFDRNAAKRFCAYIEHCPTCQLNQTKRHKPYGELQPIQSAPVLFDTIAMDFVVALPEEKYHGDTVDALLNVIDKYTKQLLLIPGKTTYTAKDWAKALLNGLQAADWELPQQILSDRDPKFLSELWTGLFSHLGVKLLLSTAWYLQTDGASEQTNQTPEAIIPIQSTLNNSGNTLTGKTPIELMYGMKVNKPLLLIGATGLYPQVSDLAQSRDLHRRQAQDAQIFAATWAK